jgi:hypothetical protein
LTLWRSSSESPKSSLGLSIGSISFHYNLGFFLLSACILNN